jgi:hypothetical protein
LGRSCDMRRAGERSFDGDGERRGVQTPSTDASAAGFERPDAANDRNALRADILDHFVAAAFGLGWASDTCLGSHRRDYRLRRHSSRQVGLD